MEEFYIVNLEENHPSVDDALKTLRIEIGRAKKRKEKYIFIIHGYGSSGKGGIIRQKARQMLSTFCKTNRLKASINGEDFNVFDENARQMLIANKKFDYLTKNYNPGITIVVL